MSSDEDDDSTVDLNRRIADNRDDDDDDDDDDDNLTCDSGVPSSDSDEEDSVLHAVKRLERYRARLEKLCKPRLFFDDEDDSSDHEEAVAAQVVVEPEEHVAKVMTILRDFPELAAEGGEGAVFLTLFEYGVDMETIREAFALAPQDLVFHNSDNISLEKRSMNFAKPSVLCFLLEKFPRIKKNLQVHTARIIVGTLVRRCFYNPKEIKSLEDLLSSIIDRHPGRYYFETLQHACEVDELDDSILQKLADNMASHFRVLPYSHVQVVTTGYIKALKMVLPRLRAVRYPQTLAYATPGEHAFCGLMNAMTTHGMHLNSLDVTFPRYLTNVSNAARQALCSLLTAAAATKDGMAKLTLRAARVGRNEDTNANDDLLVQDMARALMEQQQQNTKAQTLPCLELDGFRFEGFSQALASLMLAPQGARTLALLNCEFQEGKVPSAPILPAQTNFEPGMKVFKLTTSGLRYSQSSMQRILRLLSHVPLKELELSLQQARETSNECVEEILALVSQNRQLETLRLAYFPQVYLARLFNILSKDDHNLHALCFEIVTERTRNSIGFQAWGSVNDDANPTGFEQGLADLLRTSNATLTWCDFASGRQMQLPTLTLESITRNMKSPTLLALCREINYFLGLNAFGRKKVRTSKLALVESLMHLFRMVEGDFYDQRCLMKHPVYTEGELVEDDDDPLITSWVYELLRQKPHSWAMDEDDNNQPRPPKRPKTSSR